jgi:hypothetical protein
LLFLISVSRKCLAKVFWIWKIWKRKWQRLSSKKNNLLYKLKVSTNNVIYLSISIFSHFSYNSTPRLKTFILSKKIKECLSQSYNWWTKNMLRFGLTENISRKKNRILLFLSFLFVRKLPKVKSISVQFNNLSLFNVFIS